MQHQRQLFVLVALAIVGVVFAKNNYLEEKPTFLKSCKQTDPSFNSCFGKNFEGIFKDWKDGVPGLKSVGSIDPFHIKRISVTQSDDNPLIHMDVDLLNIKLTGLSHLEIKIVSLDLQKASGKIKIKAPKLQIDSDYKIKGRVLKLPLDGNGKANIKLDDVHADVQLQLKLRDEFDHTFADVEKLRLDISDVGGFHVDLKNLFNGQKELEEDANAIINQNWREFYTIMGPAIRDAVQAVMFDRLKKIFAYVPVKYFIEDLGTAAEFKG